MHSQVDLLTIVRLNTISVSPIWLEISRPLLWPLGDSFVVRRIPEAVGYYLGTYLPINGQPLQGTARAGNPAEATAVTEDAFRVSQETTFWPQERPGEDLIEKSPPLNANRQQLNSHRNHWFPILTDPVLLIRLLSD